MPELSGAQRSAGGFAADQVDVDEDRDWSIPTDYETLRRRPPPPVPDQSRYGPPGTNDEPRFRADGVTRWPRTGAT